MEKTEGAKVEELLYILERTDDKLLPMFFEALKTSGQSYVVDILKKKGLNVRAAIIKLSQHENLKICVALARTCVCTKLSTFI